MGDDAGDKTRRPTDAAVKLPPPNDVQNVLNANQNKLRVPGATKAYVGWRFENDWITHERAIVVLARRSDVDRVRNQLPADVGGIEIDVRSDPRPPRAGTMAVTGMLVSAEQGTI